MKRKVSWSATVQRVRRRLSQKPAFRLPSLKWPVKVRQRQTEGKTKGLTIRQKLWGLVILSLLMVIGVGGYSLFSLNDANKQTGEIVDVWNRGLDYAHELNTLAANYRALELEHIVTEDAAGKEELMTKMQDIRARINEIAPKYEATVTSATDRELFDYFARQWETYQRVSDNMLIFSTSGNNGMARS